MSDNGFSVVARRYRELRTTDPQPVGYVCECLPETPTFGVDVGCGTGRYTQLLSQQLPRKSVIVAADGNREMLRVLKRLKTPGELIQPGTSLRPSAFPLQGHRGLETPRTTVHLHANARAERTVDLGAPLPTIYRERNPPPIRVGNSRGSQQHKKPRVGIRTRFLLRAY
jgi:hypothetical protein